MGIMTMLGLASAAEVAEGTKAPAFSLTRADLADVGLEDFAGKKKILNIVVVICVVLWLLSAFGILNSSGTIQVQRIQ